MNRPCAIYVLAKNEAANIGRCLGALATARVPVIVLDSGSTDRTIEIAASHAGVAVRNYCYRSHCESYNEITQWHGNREYLLVLDADMQADERLLAAIDACFEDPAAQVAIAPITMFWEGRPVPRSSLCPPKAIAFRGGSAWFEPVGHGERLRPGVHSVVVRERLIHDDRKPYGQVLANQWRYASDLVRRAQSGRLTWRDRLRMRGPFMMLAVPLVAYVFKGGFLDGRAGMLYALDRLIAEALAFRAGISPLLREEIESAGKSGDGPRDGQTG